MDKEKPPRSASVSTCSTPQLHRQVIYRQSAPAYNSLTTNSSNESTETKDTPPDENTDICAESSANRSQPIDQCSTRSSTNDNNNRTKSPTSKDESVSPKPLRRRNEQFHRIFTDIPENEEVINAYHCAYYGDILLQGFLYVSNNWFCFYSKVLGKKCIKIPVADVTEITKKKTANIFPNAIGIVTAQDKYVFGSLMSRDNTYMLMRTVWRMNKEFNMKLVHQNDSVGQHTDYLLDSSDDSLCSEFDTATSANHSDVIPVYNDIKQSSKNATCNSSHLPTGDHKDTTSNRTYSWATKPCIWFYSQPRTILFLFISTMLAFFLLVFAMMLAYKLLQVQDQVNSLVHFDENHIHLDNEPCYSHSDRFHQNVELTRDEYHAATVRRIQTILETHIQLLKEISLTMKSLQNWTSTLSTTAV